MAAKFAGFTTFPRGPVVVDVAARDAIDNSSALEDCFDHLLAREVRASMTASVLA